MAPSSIRSVTEYERRSILSPAGGDAVLFGESDGSTSVLRRFALRRLRSTPQRVSEDSDRASRGSHVLHLATRHPVVDRTAADPDNFASLHDRERLSFNVHGRILP